MKKITVLMAIYNCEETLQEALESLLNQTCKEWKCILCDDGSEDKTIEIARKYTEKYPEEFILIKNNENKGLNYSLNRCLELADTEYVARMDGDDISLPERFEKQINFLENNKQYDIVSSCMIQFDKNGDFRTGVAIEYPTTEQVVVGSPICHAPSMIRTEAIKAVGGYTVGKKYLRVEDVDLWIKMYTNGSRSFNFSQPLYKMRDDRNAVSRRKYRYRINSTRVRLHGCRLMKLGLLCKIKCFKPMIIGLVPKPIYVICHRKKS